MKNEIERVNGYTHTSAVETWSKVRSEIYSPRKINGRIEFPVPSFCPIPITDAACRNACVKIGTPAAVAEDYIVIANRIIANTFKHFDEVIDTQGLKILDQLDPALISELKSTYDPYQRIAIRCKKKLPSVEIDWDGSWTRGFSKEMGSLIPGSDLLESVIGAEEPRFFVFAYSLISRPLLLDPKMRERFERAGTRVKLRPGAKSIPRYFEKKHIHLAINSRQFLLVIMKALEKLYSGKSSRILDNSSIHGIDSNRIDSNETDDLTSVYKGLVTARQAINDKCPVAIVGDSLYDLTQLVPFGAKSVVVAFALSGSQFAQALKDARLRQMFPTYLNNVEVLEYHSPNSLFTHPLSIS